VALRNRTSIGVPPRGADAPGDALLDREQELGGAPPSASPTFGEPTLQLRMVEAVFYTGTPAI